MSEKSPLDNEALYGPSLFSDEQILRAFEMSFPDSFSA
jgi:hypothetical protein